MVQKNSIENKLIVICGPTASGKTKLAIDLARVLNGEVISADSMIIYKNFNIGTAKPTFEEMQGIKHHLIDVCDGNDEFSVTDYKNLALPIISDIFSKGKIPIICGGTGFYINSILFDLSYGNASSNPLIREKYNQMAKEYGNLAVYNKLLEVDPESAKKLHFNDLKRVIRALEIFEESGKLKSDFNDTLTPRFDYVAFSYDYPREMLYNRIDKRVDIMLENGLVDEVKKLLDDGVKPSSQSMQGIGYKEVVDYVYGKTSYEEMVEILKRNSRRYAKRQITFFKKLKGLKYITPDFDYKKVLELL